jgi:hypothetical protein
MSIEPVEFFKFLDRLQRMALGYQVVRNAEDPMMPTYDEDVAFCGLDKKKKRVFGQELVRLGYAQITVYQEREPTVELLNPLVADIPAYESPNLYGLWKPWQHCETVDRIAAMLPAVPWTHDALTTGHLKSILETPEHYKFYLGRREDYEARYRNRFQPFLPAHPTMNYKAVLKRCDGDRHGFIEVMVGSSDMEKEIDFLIRRMKVEGMLKLNLGEILQQLKLTETSWVSGEPFHGLYRPFNLHLSDDPNRWEAQADCYIDDLNKQIEERQARLKEAVAFRHNVMKQGGWTTVYDTARSLVEKAVDKESGENNGGSEGHD